MKRRNLFVSLAILTGVLFVSCEKNGFTFGEALERQERLIQSFIEKEGLEILSEYPESGVFRDKQFVLLDNGCYLHVVDSGNGNRAIAGQTVVLMRCSAVDLLQGNSLLLDGERTIKFTFGKAKEAILSHYEKQLEPNDPVMVFLSEGVESALNYVGENAKVKMIVPFISMPNQYNTGSPYQSGSMVPYYYDELIFEFESSD